MSETFLGMLVFSISTECLSLPKLCSITEFCHTHTHIKYLVADTDTSSTRLIVQKQAQLYMQTYRHTKKNLCTKFNLTIIFIIISSTCNVPLQLEWEYPVTMSCCFAVSVQLELMNPTIRIIINKIKSIPHMYMPIKVISFMPQF